jgi:hypothetical protein
MNPRLSSHSKSSPKRNGSAKSSDRRAERPANGNPAIVAAAVRKSCWMSGVGEATGRADNMLIHVVHRRESPRPEDDVWNRGTPPLLSSYWIFAVWNCFHRRSNGQSSKGRAAHSRTEARNASRSSAATLAGSLAWSSMAAGGRGRKEAKIWDQIGVW